ncbi:MAG: cytochrome P450 [Solirubrobacteraceae bacterium]
MAVSAADEAAVVGARRSASGNGRSAPRSVSDLPGPPGLPLLGNAHQLARTSRLHLTAEQWARRYGPIIRVDIGRRRIVGISDSEEIHRILRERPDGFRRWSEQEIVVREMGPGEMRPAGVFVAEGENRKRQRRLVITALNTNHLHRYFDVVRTTTERLHRRLTGAARAGRVLDISDELTSYTLDTISWLAFEHDLNTLEHPEVELRDHIQRVFRMTARRLAEAVLRESMRLKTVGPLLGLEPLADATICDTHIPAGTRLLLLLRQAGFGEEHAGEFDSQRWLDDGEARVRKSLVFGTGPRFCPGRNLAFLEAKRALATIARNFEIELDHSRGPVSEQLNFTMIPKGLRVRLHERAPGRPVPVNGQAVG